MKDNKTLVLLVLDGWGLSCHQRGNAIAQASTPNWDSLRGKWPHSQLQASGKVVGLPEGQMGNSEVGHLNLGAGRVVYQDLTRISLAVENGSFFSNPVLLQSIEKVRVENGALHLVGLLSDGGVHSHIEHLFALLDLAARVGQRKVYIHVFLDGRDVAPVSAARYIKALESKLDQLDLGNIATIGGRYFGMDRDQRWERTKCAFDAIVHGQGVTATDAQAALTGAYERGETDEFVQPTVIMKENEPVGRVQEGDAVVCFNFRPDRVRQLTSTLVKEGFNAFERDLDPATISFISFTEYDRGFKVPVAFAPEHLHNTLGEVLSNNGLSQLRLAETEKYAHVTYFFNGGAEEPYPGEERIMVPSPEVTTYDLCPEMSAFEVTRVLQTRIAKHDVIIMNFANADMVGHTGFLKAAIAAVEAVDSCIGEIMESVLARGGTLMICGDHGNAEQMEEEGGSAFTAHTSNPVPFVVINERLVQIKLRSGALCDVAPTILSILGIAKPPEMTGNSLLIES